MTLAIGMVLANGWIASFNASAATFTTNIWNLLIAVVEAILFAVMAWKLPNRISGLALLIEGPQLLDHHRCWR